MINANDYGTKFVDISRTEIEPSNTYVQARQANLQSVKLRGFIYM